MQISPRSNMSKQPSFCGMTHIFKKQLFHNIATHDYFVKNSCSEFVGCLPKEILSAIIKQADNKAEKNTLIKQIMEAFTKTTECLTDTALCEIKVNEADFEKKGLKKIYSKIQDYFLAKIYRNAPLYFFHMKKYAKKYPKIDLSTYPYHLTESEMYRHQTTVKNAEKVLTKTFQDTKLLNVKEEIQIQLLGEGWYGRTYLIKFPEKTGFKPKVLKVYGTPKNLSSKRTSHGIVSESNAAMFVKNKYHGNFNNAKFVEGHFGSIKNSFMLNEYVFNYPKQPINEHFKVFDELNLIAWDIEDNTVNGRIIDYGGFTQIQTPPTIFLKTPQA